MVSFSNFINKVNGKKISFWKLSLTWLGVFEKWHATPKRGSKQNFLRSITSTKDESNQVIEINWVTLSVPNKKRWNSFSPSLNTNRATMIEAPKIWDLNHHTSCFKFVNHYRYPPHPLQHVSFIRDLLVSLGSINTISKYDACLFKNTSCNYLKRFILTQTSSQV